MYQIIKRGGELSLFTEETIDDIYAVIGDDIAEMIMQIEDPKPMILGAFVLHDVPLKKGGTTNIWVEYSGKVIAKDVIDATIDECVIYDDIPDIVLDKYNRLGDLAANELKADRVKLRKK